MQTKPLSLTERMINMVSEKQLAQFSHTKVHIDGPSSCPVRELFQTPTKFIEQLAKSKKAIAPGKPDESKWIKDMMFGGPMFRVFTEDEQTLARDWVTELANPPAAATEAEVLLAAEPAPLKGVHPWAPK